MDVNEFRKDLLEEVKAAAATEGGGSSFAFVQTIANYLVEAQYLPDFSYAFYNGIGKNNRKIRVDGYVYDEFDQTMNLIIADYTGDIERDTLTKTSAIQFFDRVQFFIEEALSGRLVKEIEISSAAADLVELLNFKKSEVRKYRIFLFTDGFMSGRINNIESTAYDNVIIDRQIWDIERIYKNFTNTESDTIEVDFLKFTNGVGIPCLEASIANSENYKSYLCIIPGNALADIYDEFDSHLLEGNVRSFLSTKVAVNKKIRETILKSPQNFFAYNNGVSATAIDLKVEDRDEGKFITYAKDFQIINGGQTTASLSNARRKDKASLDSIFVQMKLTLVEADSEKSTELVRNISRSSNSQNKVSDVDFFSTHPFHVRMEQISRRLYAPSKGGAQFETKWFYERAKGQWLQAQMRMTKAQKEKFVTQHPKKQLITKTDLAKIRNTWDGLPHAVSKGAQTNFLKFAESVDEKWNKNDEIFNEKYFKESVALMILFKHTEWLVSHQEWFEQGYRANIVTYALALLHKLIVQQFPKYDLDLMIIWNRQDVPDAITSELLKITKFVFEKITDPNRPTINVTQWCKRDGCWQQIQQCALMLDKSIEKLLISDTEQKTAAKEAKKDQKFVSGVEAITNVCKISPAVWQAVYDFAIEKNLCTPEMLKALKVAVKIPTWIPNEKQASLCLKIKEIAESEGFKK